jgi:hypothetical protein
MTDETDFEAVLESILLNAQYWIGLFWLRFFEEWEKKERTYVLRAPIDQDFDIVCKGGSGIGTFCIDISLSFWAQRLPGVVRNELWKMSIDIDAQWMRIVRSGGSMNSKYVNAEERSEKFDQFKKCYKMLPQRALGALALYIAESEWKYPLRAISLEWARKRNMSLVASSKVNFDYTKLFEWLGFELQNENWLSIDSFMEWIHHVGHHEADILDRMVHAFNDMRPSFEEGVAGVQLDVSHRTNELLDAFYTKYRGVRV